MGLLRQFLEGEATLDLCLRRIRERDGELRAWVEVSPQPALATGSLDGVPFGAKDIFETRGLLTEYGSPLYKGRRGEHDAELVDRLRRRGAILLGKTHTTAFAYFDPAPTRNPRNPAHTPGGSSSGSAASVAMGMVPFALGSQTQGSVVRPASFCGVVGFKPTHGLLPLEGVLPFAPSLDTAGLFTQSVDDMRLLWRGMGLLERHAAAGKIGWLETDAEEQIQKVFREALERLSAAGFHVSKVELPGGFAKVWPSVRAVNYYEGAKTHEQRWREHGDAIGVKLAALVDEGLRMNRSVYQEALATLAEQRKKMQVVFSEWPVLATPAAPGPAPAGLASTGDPRMNGPWTGLGSPAITVPMPVASALPLGLQLVANPGQDSLLVETAEKVEEAFLLHWRGGKALHP